MKLKNRIKIQRIKLKTKLKDLTPEIQTYNPESGKSSCEVNNNKSTIAEHMDLKEILEKLARRFRKKKVLEEQIKCFLESECKTEVQV